MYEGLQIPLDYFEGRLGFVVVMYLLVTSQLVAGEQAASSDRGHTELVELGELECHGIKSIGPSVLARACANVMHPYFSVDLSISHLRM